MIVHTSSEEDTSRAGEDFARRLRPGDVVLLYGDLGAGKTAFVRGMARGVGAAADDVSSPTFTLIQEYAGRETTLFHVDLYRLEPAEVDDLGLDDLLSDAGIVAIEWAERWPGRPDGYEVRIRAGSDDVRTIQIELPEKRRAHSRNADNSA